MARDLSIVLPHDLGAEEAKRRLSEGLDRLRATFKDKLTAADVAWAGPHADLKVGALGQTITGQMDVTDDKVLLTVQLPWALAALGGVAKTFLQKTGAETLKIGHDGKAPPAA